jgi:hypothetical protein
MRTLVLCLTVGILCAGCAGLSTLARRDHAGPEVSPIQVPAALKPRAMEFADLPPDTALAVAGMVRLLRGEALDIEGLDVAPGVDLAEPALPLAEFDLVGVTLLTREEREVVPGAEWETRHLALLTFEEAPFQARVATEAFCRVTPRGVTLEQAAAHHLSPAQPRVAAWFVPAADFKAALASGSLCGRELMDLAASLAIPVGPGQPEWQGEFTAVAFVLDRLETGDRVQAVLSRQPTPGLSLTRARVLAAATGFPILAQTGTGGINRAGDETFFHVTWTPAEASRTGGRATDVLVGRFATLWSPAPSSTALAAVAAARPVSLGALEGGQRFLDPRNKADAALIQGRLAELGFYKSKVDGLFGKGSRAALGAFKKSQGLPATTDWDLPTQMALFAGAGR